MRPSSNHPSIVRFTGKKKQPKSSFSMLMIFAVVFLALWLLGFATGFTVGGLIHILPVLFVLIVFYRLYQTRLVR